MTAVTADARRGGAEYTLPLSLKLALRELRGGISGFYIFVACIALGATALAAVGTLSAAIQYAIAHEGRVLLGGDVEASLVHRQATGTERAFLAARGAVSEAATLRSMARLTDGSSQALVQLKAVDGAYPLYGEPLFEDGKTLADVRRPDSVAVERGLLDQLRLKVGDSIQLGNATVRIVAVLVKEPDRLSAGPTLGPRVFTTLETLAKTGLAQPGSLIEWRYRVKTSGPLALNKDVIAKKLPRSGFQIRDHTDPSPGIRQSIDRLRDFLTLVGLTALLTGGIGVANSVSAFIERKRKVIAAYKALGAPGGLIIRSFLIQVMLVAVLGIAIGLLLGTALPFLITSFYGAILPVKLDVGFYPAPLLLASAYGLLIALIFILWPLGRASRIRAGELLREEVSGSRGWPPRIFAAASIVSGLVLAGMADFPLAGAAYRGHGAGRDRGHLRAVCRAGLWLSRCGAGAAEAPAPRTGPGARQYRRAGGPDPDRDGLAGHGAYPVDGHRPRRRLHDRRAAHAIARARPEPLLPRRQQDRIPSLQGADRRQGARLRA